MKNYILLLLMMMTAGMVSGQIKVTSNGNTMVGNTVLTPAAPLSINKSGVRDLMKIDGDNTAVRLIVNTAHSNENVGFQFQSNGVKKWSPAAYNPNGGGVDFTFYNDQKSKSALTIDGDTNNAVFRGSVTANGVLLGSDKNLKKNIKSYNGGLNKILKINPVTFNYKEDESPTYLGVIAQELQKVAPFLVREIKTHVLDSELNPTGEITSTLAIQADAVQYMLIDAIKEQQIQIIERDEKISDLEEKITKIEELINTYFAADNEMNRQNIELGEDGGLQQNEPNPFNGNTKISYVLPANTLTAELRIFDMSGRLIKNLTIDTKNKRGQISIDANAIQNGTYTYTLISDGQVIGTKKMIVAN